MYKEMRFKNGPSKRGVNREMSIIRNTLGQEDDEESQEGEEVEEEEEQFEDVRIEEGESFSQRIPQIDNRQYETSHIPNELGGTNIYVKPEQSNISPREKKPKIVAKSKQIKDEE